MSHTLFQHSMLCNALVWAWLHEVDEAEAARCREAGCRHCPGKLHSATYPRKPYGLAPELRDEGTRRFSFCCAECRLRATPPSARFFGRRFYLGALFVLVSALVLRGGVRLQTVKRKWGIPVATLRRWRTWWLEAFPATEPWGAKRGELMMPPEEVPLLFVLRRMQGGRFGRRLLLSLIWFKPWTGWCGLGDGPLLPAECDSVTPV